MFQVIEVSGGNGIHNCWHGNNMSSLYYIIWNEVSILYEVLRVQADLLLGAGYPGLRGLFH